MKHLVLFTAMVFSGLILSLPVDAEHTKKRRPVAAGSYYPADKETLNAQLASFFQASGQPESQHTVAAVIAPHAGYLFSGQIAAAAYACIDPKQEYTHVFLIGTSHYVSLNGASIYNQGNYSTPLGEVEVDTRIADRLIADNSFFGFAAGAHDREHSLEVQLPFLQYYLKKPFKIVPVIIGTQSEETCKKIAEALKPYYNEKTLFVISSDFSHYPDYKGALEADKATGEAITANAPDLFMKALKTNESKHIPGLVTSCCAWSSVLSLLYITSKLPDTRIQQVAYTNSGNSPYGDKQRVVGYHAFVVTHEKPTGTSSDFSLSPGEKDQLLKIARNTLEAYLEEGAIPFIDPSGLPEALQAPCGAFVSLYKHGNLRGCIGRFTSNEPLYKVVQEMTVAAAVKDTRFRPVEPTEKNELEMEISVLTPLKKITDIDDFELGKHGIFLVKGNRSGTYLPQVARETGWTKEEFLGHCARDKAGIGYEGWKDADLYIYEALILHEQQK
jgi:MEMO1 family protein